ncbi:MAG: hypothetical protein R2688_01900 [Fimbriimonadaceae bacterium]
MANLAQTMKTLTGKSGTFSIEVAKDWINIDTNDPIFKESFEMMKQENPKLAQIMNQSQKGEYEIYAMDSADDPSDGYVSTLNLIIRESGGLTPAMLPAVKDQVLQSIPFKAGTAKAEISKTQFGETLTFFGIMEVQTMFGKIDIMAHGYLFVKEDQLYVLTFGSKSDEYKKNKPIFEKIFKSAKIKA